MASLEQQVSWVAQTAGVYVTADRIVRVQERAR